MTKVCILTPEAAQGPFYFDPKRVRTDITEGKPGAPLSLTLQVVEAENCASLKAARVDVWNFDGLGVYSGYAARRPVRLRARLSCAALSSLMLTAVRFTTNYPGWYPGRTPHIHFRVILDDKDLVTGSLPWRWLTQGLVVQFA